MTVTDGAAGGLSLSVVVPVRDEADNVVPLCDEIAAALARAGLRDYEMIFVDDGSADATPARLLEARARHGERLRILRHRRGAGQSAALWTGFRAARAPWVATLDGDGQNDPADIARLLAARRGDGRGAAPGLVCGVRVRRHDGWLRRLSSRVANGVRGRLLGDRVPDTGCGLKLARRDAYLSLPYFDHMHRFLPALMMRQGEAVRCVPVGHRPRRHGRSKYGVHNRLWVGIVDLAGVLWLQRRMPRAEAEEMAADADPASEREPRHAA